MEHSTNRRFVPAKGKKWSQYITVVVSLIIIFSSGIHLGWPIPSLPKLLSKDSALKISPEEASYVVIVSALGQIMGHVLFAYLIDVIGRKFTLLLGAPLYLISIILIRFYATSIAFLYLGRVVGGLAEGGCMIVAPVYIGEIVDAKIRGTLISLYTVFWSGGSLFVNIVGTYCSIETTCLIILSFPVLFFILFVFMPESPYYLLMKKNVEKARSSLIKLRRTEVVDEEVSFLQNSVDQQMLEKGTFKDLFFIKSNRTALIIVGIITFLTIFTGCPSLTIYAQLFFSKTTNVMPKEWAAFLMQIFKLISIFLGIFSVDRIGRKILLLMSTGGCSIILFLVSIFFFLRDYTSLDVEKFSWLVLLGIFCFVVFCMAGLGIVNYCFMGELFSTSIKAKAVCIVNVVHSSCIFVSVKLYQSLSDNYSTGIPLLIFAVIQVLGFVFCYFCVPETKNKTLEEIQDDLKSSNSAFKSF